MATIIERHLQTFQYRILHHIITCSEWLFNIKIKYSNICSFCNETDTLLHFFVKCRKENNFGNTGLTSGKYLQIKMSRTSLMT